MLRKFLHRLGLHSWRHTFGEFNRYYTCALCGKRMMLRGVGGYQPIAQWWLDGLNERPKRTAKSELPSTDVVTDDGVREPEKVEAALSTLADLAGVAYTPDPAKPAGNTLGTDR